MPKTLAEWVTSLNGGPAPNLLTKMLRQRLKALGVRTRQEGADIVRGNTSLSKVLDPSEYIQHQLEILWADSKFWKIVRADEGGAKLREHILNEHSLVVPPMSAGVWLEAVQQRGLRAALFTTLARDHQRIAGFAALEGRSIIETELQKRKFPRIFYKYLTNPRLDGKHLLSSAEFCEKTLRAIADVATRLAEDAEWCLENPGKIPNGVLKQKRGRPATVNTARRIELLADLRRRRKGLSDSAAAEALHRERAGEAILHEVELEALRKNAAQARELLWERERIKVG